MQHYSFHLEFNTAFSLSYDMTTISTRMYVSISSMMVLIICKYEVIIRNERHFVVDDIMYKKNRNTFSCQLKEACVALLPNHVSLPYEVHQDSSPSMFSTNLLVYFL